MYNNNIIYVKAILINLCIQNFLGYNDAPLLISLLFDHPHKLFHINVQLLLLQSYQLKKHIRIADITVFTNNII